MRKVAIVGAGLTKWGVREATHKELVQEAGKALFDDIEGLEKKDVDSLFVGSALVDRLAFHWQPRVVCPKCNGDAMEWIELPSEGELFAFTAVMAGAPSGSRRTCPS